MRFSWPLLPAICLALAPALVSCARPPVHEPMVEPLIPLPVPARTMTLPAIRRALWPKSEMQRFVPSTLAERRAMTGLMTELFTAARQDVDIDLAMTNARAARVGLRLELWHHDGRTYWALLEQAGARRGAGAYVIRVTGEPATGVEVLLQAPHSFYDMSTGRIAAELFFSARERDLVRGLFVNTVHRYWTPDGPTQQRHNSPADVCHRADHMFQSATAAAALVLGEVVVIQLHGFAGTDTRPASVISAGNEDASTPLVHDLARELGPVLGEVKRFPEDINELGATTNAQGRLLAMYPRARFVHLEMSSPVRKTLRAVPDVMARFARILFTLAADVTEGGGTEVEP